MSIRLIRAFKLLLKLILITTKVWANLAIKLGLPILYFHRPYASICQKSVGTRRPPHSQTAVGGPSSVRGLGLTGCQARRFLGSARLAEAGRLRPAGLEADALGEAGRTRGCFSVFSRITMGQSDFFTGILLPVSFSMSFK